MAFAGSTARVASDPEQAARRHFIFRFSAAVTTSFVACEAMGWSPTFLAPAIAAMALANLPTQLSLKMGAALVIVMAASAYAAYALTALLQDVPPILFGIVGLIMFLSFSALAHRKAQLPAMLLLICMASIPIFTLLAPQQAVALPLAFTRGTAAAVVAIWIVQAAWPRPRLNFRPPTKAELASPMARAVLGTAIVLPLMLVYLMFGITDALPVLIATVMIVTNFDPGRGAMQGLAMMIGNFAGGMIAIIAYMVLGAAPSLATLALITLLIALLFADQVQKGGPAGGVALLTFNQAVIIFGLAIMQGSSNSGLWMTRMFQFALACTFAIGMMTLAWGRPRRPTG